MDYSSKLEWEFLHEAIDLITFKIINDVPLYFIKSCNLKRGENFEIILDITCNLDERNLSFYKNTYFLDELIFENHREILKLHYCNLKHKTVSVGKIGEYHFIFHVNNVERIYKTHNQKNVCYIKEWYLNSVRDNLIFTRPTKYSLTHEYIKIRDNSPCEDMKVREESFMGGGLDYLFLNLENFKVILQKVPDCFGPEWSNNLGFEYHLEDNFPSQDIRKKTADIVSFLMGRNLIKIGETFYDSKWNVIGGMSISSNVSSRLNLKTISNYRDFPAIKYYEEFLGKFEIEEYYSEITNAYLNCDLDLSQIMENLLMSMCVPIEAEIMMIGGCLDEISKKWFESVHSQSKGEIMGFNEFESKISEELLAIEGKLDEYQDIYKNIENSYKISGRKKVDLFLDELGITIGKSEQKARDYRNIPAHGQEMSGKTRFKMIYITDIYRTFLNRIILKLLGFHSYYDLTSGKMLLVSEKIPEKDFKENIKELEKFYYEHYKI